MRLGSFVSNEGPGFGIFNKEQVIDVSRSLPMAGFGSLRRALEALGADAIAEAAESSGHAYPLASVELRPPIPDAERWGSPSPHPRPPSRAGRWPQQARTERASAAMWPVGGDDRTEGDVAVARMIEKIEHAKVCLADLALQSCAAAR